MPDKRLLHKLQAAINNSFSNWELVTSSVLQGSILGLLLFAIYVNDMPSIVSSSPFKFIVLSLAHKIFCLYKRLGFASYINGPLAP